MTSIFWIMVVIIFMLAWVIFFTYFGVQLCNENNALGLVPLFLGLNILGLIIGIAILWNNKNNPKDKKNSENEN